MNTTIFKHIVFGRSMVVRKYAQAQDQQTLREKEGLTLIANVRVTEKIEVIQVQERKVASA